MPTNELNSYWQNIEHERAELLAKNRELRAALEEIASQPREGGIPQQVVRMQRIARAALQKARQS